MYIGLQVKYRYSGAILMNLEISQQVLRKILKYEITRKIVYWEPSYSLRTEGQTDRKTERQT
jgi:hypothetical protein